MIEYSDNSQNGEILYKMIFFSSSPNEKNPFIICCIQRVSVKSAILHSVNTKTVVYYTLSAKLLRRLVAKNVIFYIGYTWTRKEFTAVALFYAVIERALNRAKLIERKMHGIMTSPYIRNTVHLNF